MEVSAKQIPKSIFTVDLPALTQPDARPIIQLYSGNLSLPPLTLRPPGGVLNSDSREVRAEPIAALVKRTKPTRNVPAAEGPRC